MGFFPLYEARALQISEKSSLYNDTTFNILPQAVIELKKGNSMTQSVLAVGKLTFTTQPHAKNSLKKPTIKKTCC